MRKRFAIVITVAAAGVMALGTQTAAAAPDVVKFDTKVTIAVDTEPRGRIYHGFVWSDRDRNPVYHPATAVRKCMEGRRFILFKPRPGQDLELGSGRTQLEGGPEDDTPRAPWSVQTYHHRVVYAKVMPKRRDGYVCKADRSRILTVN